MMGFSACVIVVLVGVVGVLSDGDAKSHVHTKEAAVASSSSGGGTITTVAHQSGGDDVTLAAINKALADNPGLAAVAFGDGARGYDYPPQLLPLPLPFTTVVPPPNVATPTPGFGGLGAGGYGGSLPFAPWGFGKGLHLNVDAGGGLVDEAGQNYPTIEKEPESAAEPDDPIFNAIKKASAENPGLPKAWDFEIGLLLNEDAGADLFDDGCKGDNNGRDYDDYGSASAVLGEEDTVYTPSSSISLGVIDELLPSSDVGVMEKKILIKQAKDGLVPGEDNSCCRTLTDQRTAAMKMIEGICQAVHVIYGSNAEAKRAFLAALSRRLSAEDTEMQEYFIVFCLNTNAFNSLVGEALITKILPFFIHKTS